MRPFVAPFIVQFQSDCQVLLVMPENILNYSRTNFDRLLDEICLSVCLSLYIWPTP